MNVSAIGSAVADFFSSPVQKPQPGDIAADLASKVENGEIDPGKFAERLQNRFGERADGVVRQDGSVDVKTLSTLLESSAPLPRQIPGHTQPSVHDGPEVLQTQLTEEFGPDAAAKVINADGKVNFSALVDLVSQDTGRRSPSSYINETT